jgi:methionyl-tRNA formyltransferase
MRIVFFGIFSIGTASLERLVDGGFEICTVVTKPDAGTERQVVADMSERMGLPTLQPSTLKDKTLHERLSAYAPDLIVVAGFHRRLPSAILGIPRVAALNAHLSLLPRYRGPVPHKWTIINGESVTGVTIHMMTEQFDDGAILNQSKIPIAADETADSLFDRLRLVSADLLADTVRQMHDGSDTSHPQDEALASYHPNLTEADTLIDWQRDADAIDRLVRGLTTRPGARFILDGQQHRVERARNLGRRSCRSPGTVLSREHHSIVISTGSTDMRVDVR